MQAPPGNVRARSFVTPIACRTSVIRGARVNCHKPRNWRSADEHHREYRALFLWEQTALALTK